MKKIQPAVPTFLAVAIPFETYPHDILTIPFFWKTTHPPAAAGNPEVCFQSSSAGGFLNQGRRRRRYWQEVYVRGYDGGRRRRRCDKDGAKKMRIYQKLDEH